MTMPPSSWLWRNRKLGIGLACALLLLLAYFFWKSVAPPVFRFELAEIETIDDIRILATGIEAIQLRLDQRTKLEQDPSPDIISKMMAMPKNRDVTSVEELFRTSREGERTVNGVLFELKPILTEAWFNSWRDRPEAERTAELKTLLTNLRLNQLETDFRRIAEEFETNAILSKHAMPTCPDPIGSWRSIFVDEASPIHRDALSWATSLAESFHRDLEPRYVSYKAALAIDKHGWSNANHGLKLVRQTESNRSLKLFPEKATWNAEVKLMLPVVDSSDWSESPQDPAANRNEELGAGQPPVYSVASLGVFLFDVEIPYSESPLAPNYQAAQPEIVRDLLERSLRGLGLKPTYSVSSPSATWLPTEAGLVITFKMFVSDCPEISEQVTLTTSKLESMSQLSMQLHQSQDRLRRAFIDRLAHQVSFNELSFSEVDEEKLKCRFNIQPESDPIIVSGRVEHDCSLRLNQIERLADQRRIVERVSQQLTDQAELDPAASVFLRLGRIKLSNSRSPQLEGSVIQDRGRSDEERTLYFVISDRGKTSVSYSDDWIDGLERQIAELPDPPKVTLAPQDLIPLFRKEMLDQCGALGDRLRIFDPKMVRGYVCFRVAIDLDDLGFLELDTVMLGSSSEIQSKVSDLVSTEHFGACFRKQFEAQGIDHPTLGHIDAKFIMWNPYTGRLAFRCSPSWPASNSLVRGLKRSFYWTVSVDLGKAQQSLFEPKQVVATLDEQFSTFERQLVNYTRAFTNDLLYVGIERDTMAFGDGNWLSTEPLAIAFRVKIGFTDRLLIASTLKWDNAGLHLYEGAGQVLGSVSTPYFAASDPTIELEFDDDIIRRLGAGELDAIFDSTVYVGGKFTPPNPLPPMTAGGARQIAANYGFRTDPGFRLDNPWLNVIFLSGKFGGSIRDVSLKSKVTLDILESEVAEGEVNWDLARPELTGNIQARASGIASAMRQGLLWNEDKLQTDARLELLGFKFLGDLRCNFDGSPRPFHVAGDVRLPETLDYGSVHFRGTLDRGISDPDLKSIFPSILYPGQDFLVRINRSLPNYISIENITRLEDGSEIRVPIPTIDGLERERALMESINRLKQSPEIIANVKPDEQEQALFNRLTDYYQSDPRTETAYRPDTPRDPPQIERPKVAKTRTEVETDPFSSNPYASYSIEYRNETFSLIDLNSEKVIGTFTDDHTPGLRFDSGGFVFFVHEDESAIQALIFDRANTRFHVLSFTDAGLSDHQDKTSTVSSPAWAHDSNPERAIAQMFMLQHAHRMERHGYSVSINDCDGGFLLTCSIGGQQEAWVYNYRHSPKLIRHLSSKLLDPDQWSVALATRLANLATPQAPLRHEGPIVSNVLSVSDKRILESRRLDVEHFVLTCHSSNQPAWTCPTRIENLAESDAFQAHIASVESFLANSSARPRSLFVGKEGVAAVMPDGLALMPLSMSSMRMIPTESIYLWDSDSKRHLPSCLDSERERKSQRLEDWAWCAVRNFQDEKRRLKQQTGETWHVSPIGLLYQLAEENDQ